MNSFNYVKSVCPDVQTCSVKNHEATSNSRFLVGTVNEMCIHQTSKDITIIIIILMGIIEHLISGDLIPIPNELKTRTL